MVISSSKKMLSLTLLSIILPLSLLATFRLTGILQGPTAISETTTLETISWEFRRPNQFTYIDEKLEASYTGDVLSSVFYLVIGTYVENAEAYEGVDYITLAVKMNTALTNQNGFVQSVSIVLRKDSQLSQVDWLYTFLNFTNLYVIDVAHGGKGDRDAYVWLAGVNQTGKVYFSATAQWYFLTPNDRNHQLETTYELTYYNGTVYKKVIQPFQLKILGR